jgi:hypothetical protein
MLLEAEKLWEQRKDIAGADALRNMAIECFLLHFRNLRNFFYPSRDAWTNSFYFDDQIAHDFWSGWDAVEDDWSECSPDERNRLNKLLSHLSYSRRGLDHKWPIQEMSRAIRNALAQFLAALPDDRRTWFESFGV